MKARCVKCGKDWIPSKGFWSNVCQLCESPKEIGTRLLKYTNIPGYGKVLDSRIREMEKRVVIADKSDATGYHVGTLERGRIHEREPNY